MTQGNLHTDLKVNSTDSIHAHFEAVLKEATEALREDVETREEPGKIITRVGEYLVRAAESWSRLTDDLVQAPHMNGVITDAHEKARARSHLCDLSSVVQADIEISKLRYETLITALEPLMVLD